eukprot:TRINITY_DN11752_c0_g1_i1.p1 TRINITY_DN11752_c0_g1~~TRINITY_DN11752_c0_g1_i1.p1  ORF type:complete len:173 (-),score=50.08 TRINITY_DN11752_c0_g1_i1:74-592(-)
MFRYVNSKTIHPKDVIPRWKIVKGDMVKVMRGDDKGKQGKILKVLRKRNSVIVEGINLVKKHMKSTGDFKGGVFTKESPVHYSACLLVDPQTKKETTINFRYLNDGTKVRLSKESQVVIPKPPLKKKPKQRGAGPKDTSREEVHKKTFVEPKILEEYRLQSSKPSKSINDLD